MNQNKEAARVLEHPNGKRREIAQPRVSIVHQPRRDFKRQAAKLVLTVYDLGGLQLFRDMTETAARVCALEAEADGLNKRLAEIKTELQAMAPGAMPLNEEG